MDHRSTCQFGNPCHRTCQTHNQPEDTGKKTCGPDRACCERPSVTDGRCANRFHRLDRDGRLEIEADNDLEQAKTNQNPHRVHMADGNIADEERDERAEIPEGPSQILQVVFIPADPHMTLLSTFGNHHTHLDLLCLSKHQEQQKNDRCGGKHAANAC